MGLPREPGDVFRGSQQVLYNYHEVFSIPMDFRGSPDVIEVPSALWELPCRFLGFPRGFFGGPQEFFWGPTRPSEFPHTFFWGSHEVFLREPRVFGGSDELW